MPVDKHANPSDRYRNAWSEKEEALLGTMTDIALAKKLGRTRRAVEHKRRKLGVAPCVPHTKPLTNRQLAWLGIVPDHVAAKKLGLSRVHVARLRKRLKIKILWRRK